MPYDIINAFTGKESLGNPAAVYILTQQLPKEQLQKIASEIALPETSFIYKNVEEEWEIQWFSPKREVLLCGHGLIAAAFFIKQKLEKEREILSFKSKSGKLTVTMHNDQFILNFSSQRLFSKPITEKMKAAFPGAIIQEAYTTQEKDHLVLVLDSEIAVNNAKPQIAIIKLLAPHAVTITAKGAEVDFVSRYFAPHGGVDEDPVSGSSHTRLAPLWGEKLEKTKLIAKQLSNRGGFIVCEIEGERVKISGQATLSAENKDLKEDSITEISWRK